MKNNKKFSIFRQIKSFKYAISGLKILFKNEHNSRIHFVAMILAITSGIILKISLNEWISVVFSIGIVFITETLNSAIESISDFVSPEYQPLIKNTKDFSAAAVLIAACSSIIVGCIIFLPKIYNIYENI